jgi:hypothetical protein
VGAGGFVFERVRGREGFYGVNEKWGVSERGWVGNELGVSVMAGMNEGLGIVSDT